MTDSFRMHTIFNMIIYSHRKKHKQKRIETKEQYNEYRQLQKDYIYSI